MDPTEKIALGIVLLAAILFIRGIVKKKNSKSCCDSKGCGSKKPDPPKTSE